ncbi:hypothetical protein D3C80_1841840 [compost metagenome]
MRRLGLDQLVHAQCRNTAVSGLPLTLATLTAGGIQQAQLSQAWVTRASDRLQQVAKLASQALHVGQAESVVAQAIVDLQLLTHAH